MCTPTTEHALLHASSSSSSLASYHLPFMALPQSAALTTEPKTTCTAPSLALATTRVTGPKRLHSHCVRET